jgi:hypothetical protein
MAIAHKKENDRFFLKTMTTLILVGAAIFLAGFVVQNGPEISGAVAAALDQPAAVNSQATWASILPEGFEVVSARINGPLKGMSEAGWVFGVSVLGLFLPISWGLAQIRFRRACRRR